MGEKWLKEWKFWHIGECEWLLHLMAMSGNITQKKKTNSGNDFADFSEGIFETYD